MKAVIITLILIVSLAIFGSGVGVGLLVAMKLDDVSVPVTRVYPTGEQVLQEVQKYRASQNLPPFEISGMLCDNIAERWTNYVKNNSHEGFQDFINKNYPDGTTASEILVTGDTAANMVEQWKTSPSHNYYLTHNSKICVYSSGGSSVAILSN
jgi:uncharacterized protein YkwD